MGNTCSNKILLKKSPEGTHSGEFHSNPSCIIHSEAIITSYLMYTNVKSNLHFVEGIISSKNTNVENEREITFTSEWLF